MRTFSLSHHHPVVNIIAEPSACGRIFRRLHCIGKHDIIIFAQEVGMKEKYFVFAAISIVLTALILYAYNYFKPLPAPLVLIDYARSTSVPYNDLNQYLENKDGKFYLWFCDGSTDCTFINDTALRPLANEIKMGEFPEITFVDMTYARKNISPAKLKQLWGFTTYPAFVAIEVLEGQMMIGSVIQWGVNNPIGKNDVKNWMIENGIWRGLR